MLLFETNYSCSLSKVTFISMIQALNAELPPDLQDENRYVAFVDGDSVDILSSMKNIYDFRKEKKIIYVIVLLSKNKACSAVIEHLSDFVVDKKIAYADLKNLLSAMVALPHKGVVDNIFGDIWGEILTLSQKEHRVLKLLIEGYSQSQIAKILHLSIKTVSGYKVSAVKRHGARNFNELYMLKFGKRLSNV